jgi:hypothetical protein
MIISIIMGITIYPIKFVNNSAMYINYSNNNRHSNLFLVAKFIKIRML